MAFRSLYSACNSESHLSALLISLDSSSEVSWYRNLIKSFWVKIFIIGYFRLNHFLSQVDQGVPHPSQRRVYAHTCAVCDLLEAHLQVVPHDQHLLLLLG